MPNKHGTMLNIFTHKKIRKLRFIHKTNIFIEGNSLNIRRRIFLFLFLMSPTKNFMTRQVLLVLRFVIFYTSMYVWTLFRDMVIGEPPPLFPYSSWAVPISKNLPIEGVSWSPLMYLCSTWAIMLLKTLKTYLERVYHGTHSCILASLGL